MPRSDQELLMVLLTLAAGVVDAQNIDPAGPGEAGEAGEGVELGLLEWLEALPPHAIIIFVGIGTVLCCYSCPVRRAAGAQVMKDFAERVCGEFVTGLYNKFVYPSVQDGIRDLADAMEAELLRGHRGGGCGDADDLVAAAQAPTLAREYAVTIRSVEEDQPRVAQLSLNREA